MNYLSPSALRKVEEDPVRFFFDRCAPEEYRRPKEPMDLPLLVGTAFDALVKDAVAKETGLRCPSVAYGQREVTDPHALKLAADLLKGYRQCGALQAFLDEKPSDLIAVIEDFVPGTTVPVQVKPDAITLCGIHDWKSGSANNPGGMSPKPGYVICLDTDADPKGPHVRAGEPLENIDHDWATQVAIGGIMTNTKGGSIDQILCGKDGRVRVARYRNGPSAEFRAEVLQRLTAAWDMINQERLIPADVLACPELMEVLRWA